MKSDFNPMKSDAGRVNNGPNSKFAFPVTLRRDSVGPRFTDVVDNVFGSV